jgi:UDP-glucose 6-dehydrogenase
LFNHSCAHICKRFINSSIGFGGSCFQILTLVYLYETCGRKDMQTKMKYMCNMSAETHPTLEVPVMTVANLYATCSHRVELFLVELQKVDCKGNMFGRGLAYGRRTRKRGRAAQEQQGQGGEHQVAGAPQGEGPKVRLHCHASQQPHGQGST